MQILCNPMIPLSWSFRGISYINGEKSLERATTYISSSLSIDCLLSPIFRLFCLPICNRNKMPKCDFRVLRYVLINAAHNVVKNNVTFKDTLAKRWQKANLTTMPLDTAPTSLPSSLGRCSLTILYPLLRNLHSNINRF